MLKKLVRIIFAILGGLIGYGAFLLLELADDKFGIAEGVIVTELQRYTVAGVLVFLFGIIFWRLTPLINRQGHKVAENIGEDLQGTSVADVLGGSLGLILGLVIAFLVARIYTSIANAYISAVLTIITYIIMGFLGLVLGNSKGKELIAIISKSRDASQEPSANQNRFSVPAGKSRKKNDVIPKIFDTSVIIDGRIAEIMKTGFLEGPIVIPEFVLVELRHIADSSDSLKRTRGRRGLDILNKIQEDYGIDIYNTNNEKALKDIPEVDVKLLKLAQIMNGKVVTNDFNLNKVATINGVDVLNVNELANTLKPVFIPGEKMNVLPVKPGKDPNQSVAYLDDGTMIVVEDGRDAIGESTEITVTSVIQTAAGRMIFGRIKV